MSRPDWNTSAASAWPRSARLRHAEGSLRSALASALATNNRPRLWQVHLSLGRLLQSQARRREAGNEYAAARAVVARTRGNAA